MSDSSSELSSPATSEDPVVNSAASAPAPVVNDADPTPAKGPTSVLDAVTKALRPDDGVDAGSPSAEPRSPKDADAAQDKPAGADPAEISEEEMKRFSPNAQQRIRELAAQKNDLRAQLDAYTSSPEQVELKGKAENFEKLTGYLTRSGISSEEANNSLEITRLIKAGDFQTALQVMQPIYTELQKRAGEVLDPDLQQDVRLGHVPHERAIELQRLRAADTVAKTQKQVAETRQQQQEQTRANTEFVSSIARAADDWAKTKAGSDPDWDKKQHQVAEIVELDLRRNGFPKSKEETLQRSEKALEQVNARWKSLRPALTEIKPNIGNGRGASPRTDAAPKSALEAIERALG